MSSNHPENLLHPYHKKCLKNYIDYATIHITVLAPVAELADAYGSGPYVRKDVGVQVPSGAPSPWSPWFHGDPFLFNILGRNEFALPELGFAEIHGGLPPRCRSPAGVLQILSFPSDPRGAKYTLLRFLLKKKNFLRSLIFLIPQGLRALWAVFETHKIGLLQKRKG